MTNSQHIYEVRPRKDHRGFDLISDALPFGRLRYTEIPHAIDYAQFRSRSYDAIIPVYDESGNVIATSKRAFSESGDGKIYQKSSFSDGKTGRSNQ